MSEPHSSTNQEKTEPIPPSPAAEGWASAPPSAVRSGNVHGVDVPSDVPAEGTSEGLSEGLPAIAPPGLADGETDVEMPPTSSF